MDEQFDFKKKYRNILLILMTGGILVSLAAILISPNPALPGFGPMYCSNDPAFPADFP